MRLSSAKTYEKRSVIVDANARRCSQTLLRMLLRSFCASTHLHSVGLAAASLPIRENRAVVTSKARVREGLADHVKHFQLRRRRIGCVVKREWLRLRPVKKHLQVGCKLQTIWKKTALEVTVSVVGTETTPSPPRVLSVSTDGRTRTKTLIVLLLSWQTGSSSDEEPF